LAVIGHLKSLNERFDYATPLLQGVASSEEYELQVILEYLVGEGLVNIDGAGQVRVAPKGFIFADELRSRRAASSQAFVAMWFNEAMVEPREKGFKPAISAAGYSPMIIDEKEHSGKIDDEIIAEIRRSAFLIADFTEHRGGVYFEAGYAMGRGLPVIWTCRKEYIAGLHFDVRQYNCIDWTDVGDLRKRLQFRIEAVLGRGPLARQ
jgi:nucleoside 2-deoxyribosyltransferase